MSMMSLTRRFVLAGAVLGLVAGGAGRADAGPIVTFNFAGGFPGSEFTGSFSFDLATPVASTTPSPPGSVTAYEPSPSFPATFSISSGGVTSSSTATVGSLIAVFDNAQPFSAPSPRDELVLILLGEQNGIAILDIRLLDFDGTVFSSGALPATLDLAQFEVALLLVGRGEGGRPNVSGPLTSLELAPAPIPEPSTLALGGIGLAGLGLGYARHRRKRAAA